MSFFSKLRDRLTRSSSKIGAGLDDIVAEGAAGEEATPRMLLLASPQLTPRRQGRLVHLPMPETRVGDPGLQFEEEPLDFFACFGYAWPAYGLHDLSAGEF